MEAQTETPAIFLILIFPPKLKKKKKVTAVCCKNFSKDIFKEMSPVSFILYYKWLQNNNLLTLLINLQFG